MHPSMSTLTKAAPPEKADRIPKTIGYYAAFVALGMVGASLGPTLPGLAEHTQTQLLLC